MAVVYVKKGCAVHHEGSLVNLRRGSAWDDAAPLVRARPDLFEAEPQKVQGRARGGVERATAAPGEKRTLTRPKKAAGSEAD